MKSESIRQKQPDSDIQDNITMINMKENKAKRLEEEAERLR